MRTLACLLLTTFGILAASTPTPLAAKDEWTRVHSQHYLFIGNARVEEIREIATQFEQFREVFGREFAAAALNSPVPTTVVVFKSDSSYRKYKPLFQGRPAEINAYFQSGHDVNYITLSTERRQDSPYAMIFHESVHLLVDNRVRTAPGWFNEGLAEYFSTFEFLPDQKPEAPRRIVLGKPIVRHILMLRERDLLPLAKLFEIDHNSPYYNERAKSSIFYAQSWALVHYLIHSNAGKRQPQLVRFLELLASGAPVAQSFEQAFQTNYATIEKELKEYVRQDTYRVRLVAYKSLGGAATELKSEPLREAQVLTYLGDMLLHTDRLDDAEKHLRQALELEPDLSMAHASLGMLRVAQLQFADAKQHLLRAIKTDPNNYLVYYCYGYALSRESMNADQTAAGYSVESAAQMRTALMKAIELAPDFPESYRLLAFLNLVTNKRLEEANALIERALAISPGRPEFAFILAQVQLLRKDYQAARATLGKILAGNPNPQLRAQVIDLLDELAQREKYYPKQ